MGQRAGVGALGKILIFCSCLQASDHERLVVQPVTSLYRVCYSDSCSMSSISTILSVDVGVTMIEALLLVGKLYVADCTSSYASERSSTVISNCQTGDDGVVYEKSTVSFSRG